MIIWEMTISYNFIVKIIKILLNFLLSESNNGLVKIIIKIFLHVHSYHFNISTPNKLFPMIVRNKFGLT